MNDVVHLHHNKDARVKCLGSSGCTAGGLVGMAAICTNHESESTACRRLCKLACIRMHRLSHRGMLESNQNDTGAGAGVQ